MVLTGLSISLQAQTIRDEIRRNIRCSASNYMAYPGALQGQLTPAPANKKPFYISHYGRHGSRYLTSQNDYDDPYNILSTADSMDKLTPLGREVLSRLCRIRQNAYERWGELTKLGTRQNQQIMKRMVRRFPEVFEDMTNVDARSTTELSCILSMENSLIQLSRMRPQLKLHHQATRRDMYYLSLQDKKLLEQGMDSVTKAKYDLFLQKYEDHDRLMQSLFNDTTYVNRHVDASYLNYSLFKLAGNIQNTIMNDSLTLYDLFTDDEIYYNWKKENAWWYISFGGCTLNNRPLPYTQHNLLNKLIADADSCIRLEKPGVQLRYGHETAMLPLVCLLNINGYGMATSDLESIERKGWANYKISPMGANIQFIFYRENPQDKDVLFKVLLNECEAKLPLKSYMGPYYYWNDFRKYYLKKLAEYERL